MITTVADMKKFVAAVNKNFGAREAQMVNFIFMSYGEDEGRYNVANALLNAVREGNMTEIKLAAYEAGFQG